MQPDDWKGTTRCISTFSGSRKLPLFHTHAITRIPRDGYHPETLRTRQERLPLTDSTWTTIAREGADTSTLIVNYVLPLAGAAAVAQVIGAVVIGQSFGYLGTPKTPNVLAGTKTDEFPVESPRQASARNAQ
jgi:hypothetical protein